MNKIESVALRVNKGKERKVVELLNNYEKLLHHDIKLFKKIILRRIKNDKENK